MCVSVCIFTLAVRDPPITSDTHARERYVHAHLFRLLNSFFLVLCPATPWNYNQQQEQQQQALRGKLWRVYVYIYIYTNTLYTYIYYVRACIISCLVYMYMRVSVLYIYSRIFIYIYMYMPSDALGIVSDIFSTALLLSTWSLHLFTMNKNKIK